MTSRQILTLLETRHQKDVFVPECKDGPSQSGSHRRLDAWVMERSWSHPRVIGYEIKVSRQDFKQDDKWHSYLALCNQLFFACPNGLIQPEELPAQVGLLWVTKTGGKMVIKKKADYRDVSIPEKLWRYIVMCRTSIRPPGFAETGEYSRADHLRRWLEEKEESRKLSYSVAEATRNYVNKVENRNHDLERQNARLEDIRLMLQELGIKPEHAHRYNVTREIEKKRLGIAQEIGYVINEAKSSAERMLKSLEYQANRLEEVTKAQDGALIQQEMQIK